MNQLIPESGEGFVRERPSEAGLFRARVGAGEVVLTRPGSAPFMAAIVGFPGCRPHRLVADPVKLVEQYVSSASRSPSGRGP